ncbi:hypothetical protein GRJ2_001687700 [Grus japonensis]|uniref:Uncharacterized protein n=1 Tax=Grus japonensis TaxID=30415 RepID=A0ABC9X3G5_GRUJA
MLCTQLSAAQRSSYCTDCDNSQQIIQSVAASPEKSLSKPWTYPEDIKERSRVHLKSKNAEGRKYPGTLLLSNLHH